MEQLSVDARRGELGDFLRSRRDRLRPETLGLNGRRRRRTPGLRREEVAELAGIGVDWYIRLEQGRAVTPSLTTVDALARALRLDEHEHEHLRALAAVTRRKAFRLERAPEMVVRLLENLAQPAYVTGRRFDLIAWNDAAAALFGFDRVAEADRNILILILTDPRMRALFGPAWAAEAQRSVALFRATHDLWAGDPAFLELLERLRKGCGEFEKWWNRHDLRTPSSGQKEMHHPKRGLLRFNYASFQSNDDPALKLVIYTPAPD
jgi:transcriptional regulator with XRE-family HTH domain